MTFVIKYFQQKWNLFWKKVIKPLLISAYKWGVFLFASVNLENRIPSNINTLLCFARKGQAVPCSAPQRFVTTEREINIFLREVRWSVIHNPSDFAVWVWSFGRIKCHDRNRATMILLPSPRHRKDGSPHDGGGEKPMCAAKHSLYCCLMSGK